MANQLAISGGTPVRDTEKDPWPISPLNAVKEWESEIEPRLREVYLSATEGLGGQKIEELNEKYAEYSGTKYAMFMPHGTDAISAALAGAPRSGRLRRWR